jgi:hypothetical protein
MEIGQLYVIQEGNKDKISGWKLIKKEDYDNSGIFYEFEHQDKRLGLINKIVSQEQIDEEEIKISEQTNTKPTITIPFNSYTYQGLYAPERTLNTVGQEAVGKDSYFNLTLKAGDEAYRQQKAIEAAAGPRPPAPPRERPVFEEPGFRPTRGGKRRIRRSHRKTKRHSKTKRRSYRR